MSRFEITDVLPEDLIKQIQRYIDGQMLYIPRIEGYKTGWGEKSGIRTVISERNKVIKENYRNGASIDELMDLHSLSESSIKKIIYPAGK